MGQHTSCHARRNDRRMVRMCASLSCARGAILDTTEQGNPFKPGQTYGNPLFHRDGRLPPPTRPVPFGTSNGRLGFKKPALDVLDAEKRRFASIAGLCDSRRLATAATTTLGERSFFVISVTRLRRLTGEISILWRKMGVHGGSDDLGEIDPGQ
jgi:hypothetical protein